MRAVLCRARESGAIHCDPPSFTCFDVQCVICDEGEGAIKPILLSHLSRDSVKVFATPPISRIWVSTVAFSHFQQGQLGVFLLVGYILGHGVFDSQMICPLSLSLSPSLSLSLCVCVEVGREGGREGGREKERKRESIGGPWKKVGPRRAKHPLRGEMQKRNPFRRTQPQSSRGMDIAVRAGGGETYVSILFFARGRL
jgi:hypothetical protein